MDDAPSDSMERTNGAGVSNATETAGESFPNPGGSWRGSSDPLESPNYEEAMRKWVEEGGLRNQGPEEIYQPAEHFAAPLRTRLKTAGSRKQVLAVASEFLLDLLGGAESAASEGGEIEIGKGQVSDGEGGHMDLSLDQLMQIIPALTELCDADMADDVELCDADVADDVADDMATRGLLDETQGVRLLGGVCRALVPVDEAVVWLSELCENALLELCENSPFDLDGEHYTDGLDSLKSGLPENRSENGENKQTVPGGSDSVKNPPPHKGPPAESGSAAGRAEARGSERISTTKAPPLESIPAAGSQAAGNASQSSIERERTAETGDAAGDDVAAQGDDMAAPAGDDVAALDDDVATELADVAQVQVAVDLVRLGVAMFITAERLVERRKGTWAALAGDNSLHATLTRFRHHVDELSTAFGRVRKVAEQPDHLLACLVVLCEELSSTGFRVSDSAGSPRTGDDLVSDAGKFGQKDGAELVTGSGLNANEDGNADESAEAGLAGRGQGVEFAPGPSQDRATGVHRMGTNSDGEETGLVGEGRVSDDRETVAEETVLVKDRKDRGRHEREGSFAGEERPSEGADLPAESAPRTRVGRNRKAPSAWWAVVGENAADGKPSENVRKGGKSASESVRNGGKWASESVRKRRKRVSESAGKEGGPSESVRTFEEASESVRMEEGSSEEIPEAADEAVVEIAGEGAEIDLEEEEIRYDKRSKRRRKALSYKRRKAQARAPSQNRFVAYAIEEQMLDSESEWDSDQYSDLEDFIALENEDVDFKTMPLSTITPYVPYGDADEDAAGGAQALPAQKGQVLGHGLTSFQE